jgi:hypothetical protein
MLEHTGNMKEGHLGVEMEASYLLVGLDVTVQLSSVSDPMTSSTCEMNPDADAII